MPTIYRECIQCNADFYITEKDQRFFESRDLELPKRCWKCRQENKRKAEAARAAQQAEERQQRGNGNRRRSRAPQQAGGVVEFFVEDKRPARRNRQGRGQRR